MNKSQSCLVDLHVSLEPLEALWVEVVGVDDGFVEGGGNGEGTDAGKDVKQLVAPPDHLDHPLVLRRQPRVPINLFERGRFVNFNGVVVEKSTTSPYDKK